MRYEAPETVEAAVKLLAGNKGLGRILAGGTDLLVQMRSSMVEPDLVVDIKKIPAMHKITTEKGGFRIGAAVSGATCVVTVAAPDGLDTLPAAS